MRLNDTLDPELMAFTGGSGKEVHVEAQTLALWGIGAGVNKPGMPTFWAKERRKGTPHQNHQMGRGLWGLWEGFGCYKKYL